ncbi:hypothetical protein M407DRAFT_119755 [Tulasnella calospora MUT 4182]|uniref:DOMON domain-containing protein n=1 Tax=Tulasnella calospora MUT 4182 TaxID=1051891 RepID=A0A0C3KLH3_9AGAM|nr:hypothetical protein M407DRAFT_119755 [Tulasnella calospora MUT 4182]
MAVLTIILSLFLSTVQAATGGQFCGKNLCVNAVVNGDSVTYQLVSPFAIDKLGWMAVGFGTKMSNAPMIITWPNSDGTITISQRESTDHSMPTVIANPSDTATLVAENTILSTNSTSIAFSYPLPNISLSAVPMIWAYSNAKPASSAVDAKIVQHAKMGAVTMDLTQSVSDLSVATDVTTTVIGTSTQTIVSLPTGVSSNGTSSEDTSLTDEENTIRTHGILMTVGFLLCLPLGIFIARFSRTVSFLKDKWFTAHWFVQFVVSGPIIVAGWFIGYNYVGDDHFQDSHTRAGLLLLLLYIAQMILGTIIHFFKPKRKPLPPLEPYYFAGEPSSSTRLQPMAEPSQTTSVLESYPPTLAAPSTTALVGKTKTPALPTHPSAKDTIVPAIKARPIQNYAHALLGLFIILLSVYNVHEGYGDEWLGEFGTYVYQVSFLRHLRAWWTVAIIVLPLVYIAGLFLLPRQWRQETNARRTMPTAGTGFQALSA